jgi:small subunit ribosomal protein S16
MGSHNKPFYRIVVSDSRRTPSAGFIETIGTYDPATKPARVTLDTAKADEWIRKGAHPSETVASLIERARPVAG